MLVDLVVILLLLGQAVRGFRAGFRVVALSLLGQALGAVAGLVAGPPLVAAVPDLTGTTLASSVALVAVVVLGAAAGEALLSGLGRWLRARTRHEAVRSVDGVLGAAAGAAVAAVVISLVASAVTPVLPRPAARALQSSATLGVLDQAMPPQVKRWSQDLTALLDAADFPEVFSQLPEPSASGPAPDPGVTASAGVRAVARSIVKVSADAAPCGSGSEGSGWVAAPQRVITNAHVVAGATSVSVQSRGVGATLAARVVAYDPRLDLAVLAVPGLDAAPLKLAGSLPDGASAVVAGFPLNGPYALDAARVSQTMDAAGADIYGRPGVNRQVYVIRAHIQPGNSGGPLLTPTGEVAGTVFGRGALTPGIGYVLTNAATASLVSGAATASGTVSTQSCLVG